jgi:hypothetical protein
MTGSYVKVQGAEAKLRGAGKQAPFAMALALTGLARDGKLVVDRSMPVRFDNPTAFTLQAITVVAATKDTLLSQVVVKDDQAKYLDIEERGGVRLPESGAPVILPVLIGTNVHGNIPKGKLGREKAKPGVFVATANDPETKHLKPGVYRRRKFKGVTRHSDTMGVQLLAAFGARAQYTPRFGFSETVMEAVRRLAPARLREALSRALATARR